MFRKQPNIKFFKLLRTECSHLQIHPLRPKFTSSDAPTKTLGSHYGIRIDN